MNLRKFSQQTYFKSKKPSNPTETSSQIYKTEQNEVIDDQPDEPQELLTEATPKKESLTPVAKLQKMEDMLGEQIITPKPTRLKQKSKDRLSATSQLLRKFKSQKREISPIFKTEETTYFNQSICINSQQKQSKKEQQEVVDRLIRWGTKKDERLKETRKANLEKEKKIVTGKPQINAESVKTVEKGIKKYANIELLIKSQDVAIQTMFDHQPLQRLKKYRQKIIIEYEQEQEYEQDQENMNDKETQINMVIVDQSKKMSVVDDLIDQSIVSKQSIHDISTIPVQLRFKYDQLLKEAKIQQIKDEEERKYQLEQNNRKKTNSNHDSFKHFLQEQESFMKKRDQKLNKQYEAKLKLQQEQNDQIQFKPSINQISNKVIDELGKFDVRMNNYQKNKVMKVEREKELSLPSFQPQISAKSRKIANFMYSSMQSQFDGEYNSLKNYDSQR